MTRTIEEMKRIPHPRRAIWGKRLITVGAVVMTAGSWGAGSPSLLDPPPVARGRKRVDPQEERATQVIQLLPKDQQEALTGDILERFKRGRDDKRTFLINVLGTFNASVLQDSSLRDNSVFMNFVTTEFGPELTKAQEHLRKPLETEKANAIYYFLSTPLQNVLERLKSEKGR